MNNKRFVIHPRLVSTVGLVGGWYLITLFVPKYILPSPQRVAQELLNIITQGSVTSQVISTLEKVLIGLIVAMLIGLVVGIMMGMSYYWEKFFRTWVMCGLSVPGLIFALLGIMWFGLNMLAPLTAIILVTFPYIAVNMFEGVRAVDKQLLDMGRTFGVYRTNMLLKVVLPSMVPFVLVSIRQGLSIAWKTAAVAEVFGSTSGIGFMIRTNFDSFSIAGILSWTFIFAALVLVIEYGIILPFQRRILKWRPEIGEIF